MRLRLNDLNIVFRFRIQSVSLRRDAVPIQLPSLSVLVPIQFMNFENRAFQVVRVQLFEFMNNCVNFVA